MSANKSLRLLLAFGSPKNIRIHVVESHRSQDISTKKLCTAFPRVFIRKTPKIENIFNSVSIFVHSIAPSAVTIVVRVKNTHGVVQDQTRLLAWDSDSEVDHDQYNWKSRKTETYSPGHARSTKTQPFGSWPRPLVLGSLGIWHGEMVPSRNSDFSLRVGISKFRINRDQLFKNQNHSEDKTSYRNQYD